MLRVFTGLNALQIIKITPKRGEKEMLTNLLAIIPPFDPIGNDGENATWPFCTSPVFAIFNWLF